MTTADRQWTAPPDSAALIRAFDGDLEREQAEHPVVELAEALATHHRQRWAITEDGRAGIQPGEPVWALRLVDELDSRRASLIDQIDGWALAMINSRPTAPLHTETLGSVIDRLALFWVHTTQPGTASPDRQVAGNALGQLTELSEAYDDLVRDLARGRRRLPTWRPLKRANFTPRHPTGQRCSTNRASCSAAGTPCASNMHRADTPRSTKQSACLCTTNTAALTPSPASLGGLGSSSNCSVVSAPAAELSKANDRMRASRICRAPRWPGRHSPSTPRP